jgi:hypothetical protein
MPRATTRVAANRKVADALSQPMLIVDRETGDVVGDGLGDLFAPLEDTVDTYNMCFWGREGSGKTTALATAANIAPEGSKILVVNAEGGLKLAAMKRRGIDTSKIVIYPNPERNERITRAGLERVYRRVSAELSKDPASWYMVAWDSVTEVHEAIVGQVSEGRLAKAKKRIEDAGGVAQFDEADEFFTDRDDYGTMSKMVKDLLRKFRDLPCHFVATALERRDVDEKTSKVTYGPAVTPGLQNAILGYTDLNLYFKQEDEDGPFRALVRGVSSYRTKDRMGGLPKVIAEPTFQRILGYTDGTIAEAEDDLQKALPAVQPPKVRPTGKKVRPVAPKPEEEATDEKAEAEEAEDE